MAKQFFKDLPDTTTPLTASRLNGLLDGEEALGSIVVDDVNCKNIFDGILELGNYSNSTGEKFDANNLYRNANPIPVKPNTTYTFSINGVSQKYCTYYYGAGGTFLSYDTSLTTGTFTTPANCYYVNFRCFGSDFTNDYATLKVQLELGENATNYTKGKKIIKEQNGYVKENTTFYADDFKCKNLFIPTKTNNGTDIALSNATLSINDDEFVFVATGSDVYFGNIRNTGDNYQDNRGILIDVEGISSISFTLTNPVFNQTYITAYDSTKKSLGYVYRNLSSGSYNIPALAKYITIRFGLNNATSGTTYRTKVQIEVGEQTPYTPYKNFENEEIYSTNEVKIGTWIDGNPIYRKVINFGALPNATSKTVNNDVSNISEIIRAYGYATNGTNYFPIPFANTTANQSITLVAKKTSVEITTGIDRSPYSNCYIIIEYTKTTSGTRMLNVVNEGDGENR